MYELTCILEIVHSQVKVDFNYLYSFQIVLLSASPQWEM